MPETPTKKPPGFNQKVYDFQLALSSFGIPYHLPKDGSKNGIPDTAFVIAVRALESKLQAKTGEKVFGTIISGNSLLMSADEVAKKFFGKEQKSDKQTQEVTETSKEENADSLIKSFQTLLSQTLPVAGKLYLGPIDGIVNKDLIKAAKSLEQVISSNIEGKTLNGVIWSDYKKSFNTTPDDIKKALELLELNNKNSKQKTSSNLDQRFIKLAKILNS